MYVDSGENWAGLDVSYDIVITVKGERLPKRGVHGCLEGKQRNAIGSGHICFNYMSLCTSQEGQARK